MKFFKQCMAAFLALACLLSFSACGESTAYVMTIDDYDIRAGVYIYYSVNAYYDAIEVLSDQGVDFNSAKTTEDIRKLVEDVQIDAVSSEEWIQNKATEYCRQYVAIAEEFDRLGLELTADEKDEAEQYRDSNWATLGDFYTDCGVGKQSLEDVLISDQKKDRIYQHYYGNDGEKGVTEQALKDYYKDNNARVEYVKLSLTDGAGNLLKADGKAKMMEMAEGYLARLEAAKDEAAMLEEFDYVIEDYKNYATSLSAAAVTTTDESGNTITTATTTTTKRTTPTDATTAGTDETTGDNAETTTTAAETTAAGDETTTAGDASAETTTTTTAAETTTTAAETTTAETDANGSTVTTTTTARFANESIIPKMTTTSAAEKKEPDNADGAETTTTTAVSYTPSEKAYNFIYNDATIGKPEIVEEDENYYVIVRLNIEDRMTEDDLWTESQMESVRKTIYGEEFDKFVEELGGKYAEERNARAYRRYNPLDLDLMAYTQALYSSYYGGSY